MQMKNDNPKRVDEPSAEAIAAYAGPITICPPGRARAPKPTPSRAAVWLNEHRGDRPPPNQKQKRRRERMARQKRERIAARNGPLLMRLNKQR